MIDYAHTPESLDNILTTVQEYTIGEVICVFGCGGDRDAGKRPIMGEIAGTKADYTIITSDNPRTEKPEDIVAEIEKRATPKTFEEIRAVLQEIVQKYEGEVDVIAFATAGAVNNENTGVLGSTGNIAPG